MVPVVGSNEVLCISDIYGLYVEHQKGSAEDLMRFALLALIKSSILVLPDTNACVRQDEGTSRMQR